MSGDTGHHESIELGRPSMRDVCVCGHLYGGHHGPGTCLVALTATAKAAGAVRAPLSAICPCDAYRPAGIRWIPPADPEARARLKAPTVDVRAEHPRTLGG